MALGNIECPNCGSTFEYDSEKAIATCPHCGAQFIVRNVKMDTIVTNNYYNNMPQKTNNLLNKNDKNSDYESLFKRFIAYANNEDRTLIQNVAIETYNKYPDSYLQLLYKKYKESGEFISFLSKKNFCEYLSSSKEIVTDSINWYDIIWIELNNDKYLIKNSDYYFNVLTKNYDSPIDYAKKVINDIDNQNTPGENTEIVIYEFVKFIESLEKEVKRENIIKYNFEKEHFDSLVSLKEVANEKMHAYEEYNKQINLFVKNNKMKCDEYLDWINEARTYDASYYSYGVEKDNSVTGIFCQVIGIVIFLVGFVLSIVGYVFVDSAPELLAIGSLIALPGYVISFIGFLRFNDFQNGRKWAFVLLPPALIVMTIIYMFKNIYFISRSKRSKKIANKKINAVANDLKVYRNSAKYNTVSDMFDAFKFDYNLLDI